MFRKERYLQIPQIVQEAAERSLWISSTYEKSKMEIGLRQETHLHLMEYGQITDKKDPYVELADRVPLEVGEFNFDVNLVSTRLRGRLTDVIGFESHSLNRFLLIPTGGGSELYEGKYQKKLDAMFPGSTATLAELRDFELLLGLAIREDRKRPPLRSTGDFTIEWLQSLPLSIRFARQFRDLANEADRHSEVITAPKSTGQFELPEKR